MAPDIPTFSRPPSGLVAAFGAALPQDERVLRRSMFGSACAFTGGNMFAGVHGDRVMVRLKDPEHAQLLAMDGAAVFEPMPGRPMREYILVPASMADDPGTLADWLQRGFEYGLSLPAKEPKPKKKR